VGDENRNHRREILPVAMPAGSEDAHGCGQRHWTYAFHHTATMAIDLDGWKMTFHDEFSIEGRIRQPASSIICLSYRARYPVTCPARHSELYLSRPGGQELHRGIFIHSLDVDQAKVTNPG
jgi:hypothetical protein